MLFPPSLNPIHDAMQDASPQVIAEISTAFTPKNEDHHYRMYIARAEAASGDSRSRA